jgi:hypothetical protein
MENHLSFHMNVGSLDVVKEHSLLSYIDHVFAVESNKANNEIKQSNEIQGVGIAAAVASQEAGVEDSPSSSKVEVCSATLNMKWFNKKEKRNKEVYIYITALIPLSLNCPT